MLTSGGSEEATLFPGAAAAAAAVARSGNCIPRLQRPGASNVFTLPAGAGSSQQQGAAQRREPPWGERASERVRGCPRTSNHAGPVASRPVPPLARPLPATLLLLRGARPRHSGGPSSARGDRRGAGGDEWEHCLAWDRGWGRSEGGRSGSGEAVVCFEDARGVGEVGAGVQQREEGAGGKRETSLPSARLAFVETCRSSNYSAGCRGQTWGLDEGGREAGWLAGYWKGLRTERLVSLPRLHCSDSDQPWGAVARSAGDPVSGPCWGRREGGKFLLRRTWEAAGSDRESLSLFTHTHAPPPPQSQVCGK